MPCKSQAWYIVLPDTIHQDVNLVLVGEVVGVDYRRRIRVFVSKRDGAAALGHQKCGGECHKACVPRLERFSCAPCPGAIRQISAKEHLNILGFSRSVFGADQTGGLRTGGWHTVLTDFGVSIICNIFKKNLILSDVRWRVSITVLQNNRTQNFSVQYFTSNYKHLIFLNCIFPMKFLSFGCLQKQRGISGDCSILKSALLMDWNPKILLEIIRLS